MDASYNGFAASKDPAELGGLDNRVIPGTDGAKYAPGIRAGAIAVIAFWWGWQWTTRIERIVPGTCWGYFWKNSANSKALLSCHSGGSAWDTMAPSHPNGKRGTLTGPALQAGRTKLQVLREMLAYLEGVVYSGVDAWGDGTPDEMHAEIATGAKLAKVEQVAAKILRDFGPIEGWAGRSPFLAAAATVVDQLVAGLQRAAHVTPDGAWGPNTDRSLCLIQSGAFHAQLGNVADLQTAIGVKADGKWGPQSKAALAAAVTAIQQALGLGADGVWGPKTEAAFAAARAARLRR